MLASLAVLVGLWELSALAFPSGHPFPPPSQFIPHVLQSGGMIGIGAQATTLPEACLLSLMRVGVGLCLAIGFALPVAILIAGSRHTYRALLPLFQFLSPIAPVAWVPLGLLLFGIGDGTAVFIVFMGVVFLLTLGFAVAIRRKLVEHRELADALSAGRGARLMLIAVPAAAPALLGVVRMNFLAAWVAVLAGEMTGLGSGLGSVIMLGRNLYDYNLVALGVSLIAILGLSIELLLSRFQESVLWW